MSDIRWGPGPFCGGKGAPVGILCVMWLVPSHRFGLLCVVVVGRAIVEGRVSISKIGSEIDLSITYSCS